MTAPFLPYGRQEISDGDVEAVVEALRADLITQGPRVEEFEGALASYVGAKHAVAFANGTAALHAAAAAAGLGPGDEAITSPITFAASANCALYRGARPVFVDVDPATWNLDPGAAVERAGSGTRAVIPVSLAGLPADLGPLQELRGRVTIIEDGCHALGGHRDGVMVGGPGGADMTAFSFHPVKGMTTGEGGAITTEDDELAERLRNFRTHGITRAARHLPADPDPWYYEMVELGFNYRITDIQCALGVSQLGRLDGWIERRNQIADRYRELLAGEQRLTLPPAGPSGSLHAYHLFVVAVHGGAGARRRVFEELRSARLGVQVHYIPVYRLQYYRETLGYPQDACPAAEEYYAGAISLPMFPAMSDQDVDSVVERLGAAL
jgi:UDP-4-amino-4,6-dideoxy-N-acetyl-beta-L-altrosamine transaminase